jgi:nitrite reductase (NADH) large subunit
MSIADITLNDEHWYSDNGITLHLDKTVEQIQRGYKKVITEDGTQSEYDQLIIATGSSPFMIPIPGTDKEGVITFRNIDDCNVMVETAKQYKRAAVIGGGLLGLEAAKGLINLGMEVTVVHDQSTLMNMQLDEVAGEMLRISLQAQGMDLRLATLTTAVLGKERVTGLLFADGTTLDCDLLVMAAGIRPNKALAEASGLYCNRGIIVNDHMQTVTDPSVYAVGGVYRAPWRHLRPGSAAFRASQDTRLPDHRSGAQILRRVGRIHQAESLRR